MFIKIVIPKSEEAAKYYGRNTKWCTSAEKNNMYQHYAEAGELYIILFKKTNIRWQFHFEKCQFMDEKDDDLPYFEVQKVSHLFKDEEWMSALTENINNIKYIKTPSEKIMMYVVEINGSFIKYFTNPSEKVQLAAVYENSHAIQYIENPTEEVQIEVVNADGRLIEYINNPSEKVQLVAILDDWRAITYIDNPTEKAQLLAVRNHRDSIKYIENPTDAVKKLFTMQVYKD